MFDARTAPTPKDTVFRDGRGSVYRFRGAASTGSHVPVLLVPSMINRWYVLDLREGASVAAALSTGAPWETFLFDWGVPEDEDRYLGWDDVVARLDRVVRRVLRMTGAPKLAIVGYSIGATLCGIYSALHPERIAALINLAGPFDFSEAGRLGAMVDPRWFDPAAMTAAGNLAPWQMQAGLQALTPTYAISRWVQLANEIHDPDARAAFAALDAWGSDTVPFPASAYVTYIKELYQQNRLIRGEHHILGQRVDLSKITCPVMSVVAEMDEVCPPKAATALNDHTSSKVKDVLFVRGGHVGAVVGNDAATDLYPRMEKWLEKHGALASTSARVPESRL